MATDEQVWQAPPPPENPLIVQEKPEMSLVQTLFNIFIEPGAVFEDLRKKPFPRLIFPLVICAVLIAVYGFSLNQKLGGERIMREQLNSKIMQQVPEETKKKMLEDAKNVSVTQTVLTSSVGGIVFFVIFGLMGLIYWGGGLTFGGSGNYWHGLSVVAYSTYPLVLISMIASLVILYFKPVEDISYLDSQSGLLKLNPGMFLGGSGVIKALFSRFDLLALWGVFLSAVGMQKCFNISNSSAWIFSIIIWLLGTTFAVVMGLIFG